MGITLKISSSSGSPGKSVKMGMDHFKFIGLFESMTNAHVKDCVILPDRLVFIINEGDMGLAIGKGGANVKKVETALQGKKVDLIEYSKDPIQYLKNILYPMKIKNAYNSEKSDGKKILTIDLDSHDKKKLLSSGKKRLNEAKEYFLRHHKVDDIEVV